MYKSLNIGDTIRTLTHTYVFLLQYSLQGVCWHSQTPFLTTYYRLNKVVNIDILNLPQILDIIYIQQHQEPT